jgi:hypothetical protein
LLENTIEELLRKIQPAEKQRRVFFPKGIESAIGTNGSWRVLICQHLYTESSYKGIEGRRIFKTAPQVHPSVEGKEIGNAFLIGSFEQDGNHRKPSPCLLLDGLPSKGELHFTLLDGAESVPTDEHGYTPDLAQRRFELVEPRLARSQVRPIVEGGDVSQAQNLPDSHDRVAVATVVTQKEVTLAAV